MKTTFNESQLATLFSKTTSDLTNGRWVVEAPDAPLLIETILMGMADLAVTVKAKDKPVAVVIDDLKGNPVFGLKLEWMEGSSDIPEGSWNPSWSFKKEDFDGCQLYSVSESRNYLPFVARAQSNRFYFPDPNQIYTVALAFAQSMSKWLSDQLDANQAVEIEYPGFFTAEGHVIDGVKELAFSPSEEIAALTKDDSGLQATA